MRKGKIAALTKTQSYYISEKEITVNGKSCWLVKDGKHINISDGKKILFDGTANEYHAWRRAQN